MRHFTLKVRVSRGSLLVGGYSANPDAVDAIHARDREGRPLIPATALRGALRETLETLLRGAGQPACCGGSGIDAASSSAGPGPPCRLDQGGPCKACRLFGRQRTGLEPGEVDFSALVLRDAIAHAEGAWTRRHHVTISRRHRSAQENLLFEAEVPAPGGIEVLTARGWLAGTDPDLEKCLVAAARATSHVGAARSRGFGRVEIGLDWEEAGTEPAPRASHVEASGDVHVRVTLETPTALCLPLGNDNARTTRHEVPGSSLRGAIGFAIARQTEGADADPALQTLVAEEGAHFGFLYPAAPCSQGSLPGPWPITARACKNAGPEHGVVDTLIDEIAGRLAPCAASAAAASRRALRTCPCGAPLERAPGWRTQAERPLVRVVTRVGLDRRRSSALEAALFSHELIEPGATFQGTIRNVPPASRERLLGALSGPLSLGRGRAMGWGHVKAEQLSPYALPPLHERGVAFEEKLRQHLETLELPVDDVGAFVAFTALSPIIPGDEPRASGEETPADATEGLRAIGEALGVELDLLVSARRFVLEGGWAQRSHERGEAGARPTAAIAAGAVFVGRLSSGSWRHLGAELARIEREGVGDRRHQGFGQILCFDPVFLRREFTA